MGDHRTPQESDCELMTTELTMRSIDPLQLQDILARHLAMYRRKVPFYQATMLDSLRELWAGNHRKLLDVGGGTGVIAEAMAELFRIDQVEAVDLVDRFCRSLSVSTRQFDGKTLPFADGSFDSATLNNVVHHVPVAARTGLLREIRRVVDGPLYIKDHESRGRLDNLRLTAMDAIGNIPFGGMLWARYLGRSEWERLAAESGYRIAARAAPARYRRGPYALLFPNRLEVTMRFEPA
jgi:SAM-dependent methyltransferase